MNILSSLHLKETIQLFIFSPIRLYDDFFHRNQNKLRKENVKLVMTLLARNEDDILRDNIEFHLKSGVDFIIATDNASTDNTRNIFKEYEKKGKLFLIDEPSKNMSQAAWNNRMMRIAKDTYGADIIFHCDADEFWCSHSGNLKNELPEDRADMLTVDVVNVLLEDTGGDEIFPKDTKYAMIHPIIPDDYKEDTKTTNMYFFKYHPKVMFKTAKGYLEVVHGNHALSGLNPRIRNKVSTDITIYHFPMRGKKVFYKKTIEHGSAIENNSKTLKEKNTSWHIRRWYEAYKIGRLDEEYNKLKITNEEANKMMRAGIIEKFDYGKFLGNNQNDNFP